MSTPHASVADELDAACLTAHSEDGGGQSTRGNLVAIFSGQVAHELLLIGARIGYTIALIEPDEALRTRAAGRIPGLATASSVESMPLIDDSADVVMTDHHRDELGPMLRDLLDTSARWIGLMGSPRHEGPHVAALRSLGVDQSAIDRIHRPIGLNIGSRTPGEIAIATLAGLIATRAGRPGGFDFA